MSALTFVYADVADPAAGVVIREPGEPSRHGTCAMIAAGPAWVIDRENDFGSVGALEAANAGIVLPRVVLVTRSPVRLV